MPGIDWLTGSALTGELASMTPHEGKPMRKILYSPGFGAGWTSWEPDHDVAKLMIDWPPLIAAVEAGKTVYEDHPAVQSLLKAIAAIGKGNPYLGGLHQLKVAAVNGRVRINEYDGSESYEEEGEYAGWL